MAIDWRDSCKMFLLKRQHSKRFRGRQNHFPMNELAFQSILPNVDSGIRVIPPKTFVGLLSQQWDLLTPHGKDGVFIPDTPPAGEASGLGWLDLHSCPGQQLIHSSVQWQEACDVVQDISRRGAAFSLMALLTPPSTGLVPMRITYL